MHTSPRISSIESLLRLLSRLRVLRSAFFALSWLPIQGESIGSVLCGVADGHGAARGALRRHRHAGDVVALPPTARLGRARRPVGRPRAPNPLARLIAGMPAAVHRPVVERRATDRARRRLSGAHGLAPGGAAAEWLTTRRPGCRRDAVPADGSGLWIRKNSGATNPE